jgi:RNA polymerase sigma-70 factor, ECF subfamily
VVGLVEVFRAHAPAAIADSVDDGAIGAAIAAWLGAARAAWPSVIVDERAFVAHVAARLGSPTLDTIAAADLWLTCACVAGDPGAFAAFDAHYVATLDPVLASNGLAADQIDEVKQELRRKLLVRDADGAPPRLDGFSGRADLRRWVRTTALRAGIDLYRGRGELPADDDQLARLPAIADDPELQYLKTRYRGELEDAIRAAIGRLAPRERLLLKYHHLDGLGVDPIAAMYGVHRATAARWIAAAREALADRAQEILLARMGVTRTELRSIARLVESQLDVSMRRLLA